MGDAIKTVKIECRVCKTITVHEVVRSFEHRDESDDPEYRTYCDYSDRIVQCRGCEATSFQRISWFSEDYDPETGRPYADETVYPPRSSGKEPMAAELHFPDTVGKIYKETISSLNAGAPTLASIGLRALVEAICIDQKCQSDKLHEKIDELVTIGLLSKKQAGFLHLHRFMGNAAAHELETPTSREIDSALDIIENLLKTIYELPEKARGLERAQERRSAVKAARAPVAE